MEKNNHLSQSLWIHQSAQLQVLGHLKLFLIHCSPWCLPVVCSSNMLLASVFRDSKLWYKSGKIEIGPSGKPPDKLECWTHGPLFCFHIKRELWSERFPPSCSALCCTEEGQAWVCQMQQIYLPLLLESLLGFTVTWLLWLLDWSLKFSQR